MGDNPHNTDFILQNTICSQLEDDSIYLATLSCLRRDAYSGRRRLWIQASQIEKTSGVLQKFRMPLLPVTSLFMRSKNSGVLRWICLLLELKADFLVQMIENVKRDVKFLKALLSGYENLVKFDETYEEHYNIHALLGLSSSAATFHGEITNEGYIKDKIWRIWAIMMGCGSCLGVAFTAAMVIGSVKKLCEDEICRSVLQVVANIRMLKCSIFDRFVVAFLTILLCFCIDGLFIVFDSRYFVRLHIISWFFWWTVISGLVVCFLVQRFAFVCNGGMPVSRRAAMLCCGSRVVDGLVSAGIAEVVDNADNLLSSNYFDLGSCTETVVHEGQNSEGNLISAIDKPTPEKSKAI
ncbi:hypothetical protein QVD17_24629 [Tagetes erecta]|uniref:Uncharacterized protein n=1 Tax=Tagetes erecta TaxID=13708 RepID=A0AAD8NV48_TARER|nr:hypothetical protein QVD17_24629 [Tagetes erecta]